MKKAPRYYTMLVQNCLLKQKLFLKIYSERSRTMKKLTKEYFNQTIKDLEKQVQILREEIANTKLNEKVNPSKDSNILIKKRHQLAVLLTVLAQKKELEKIKEK